MTAAVKFKLKLYVTGLTPAATQAIESVRALELRLGPDRTAIEIIEIGRAHV